MNERRSFPLRRDAPFSYHRVAYASKQWWARFLAFARAYNRTPEVQARRLPSLVTRKAFQVIGKLLIEGREPAEIVELYRSILQKSFGLSPEKAFLQLCARQSDSSKDIDGYASDIVPRIAIHSVSYPQSAAAGYGYTGSKESNRKTLSSILQFRMPFPDLFHVSCTL